MEKLTCMGEPFSIIYLDQIFAQSPVREEVSFMDTITRIPSQVEEARVTGSVAPKASDPGARVSF